jgi:LPXTG-motif cell wall-anchored protein
VARRFVGTALITVVALILLAPAALAQADTDCSDYASQAAAQAALRADPSDPNGLDGDGDGIACESNPAPFDRTPVTSAAGGISQGGATEAGALPRTGSRTPQVASVAGLLMAAGSIVLWMTRYRPRHAS